MPRQSAVSTACAARAWRLLLSLAVLAAVLPAALPGVFRGEGTTVPATTGTAQVIVRASTGVAAARAAVESVRGQVLRPLGLIDAVVARVRPGTARRLAAQPGIVAVTPDVRGHLTSVDPALGFDATGDFGSLFNVARVAGVHAAWRAGYTGKGVDVALIDSGVSAVPGLLSGNVVNGPDLSFESQVPGLAHRDTFGHGTHMAGIIVGRDAESAPSSYADPKRFAGMAPDARLVSIKVASADGGVDVSQVIAALDWVTQHAHDPGFNIRVVNLSFGTDSAQSFRVDPLSFAAEAAWRKGIVVVAAAGNDGTAQERLSDPAMNPTLLAVGAEDPRGTVSTADDTVPAFASRGTVARHADLVAPAVHVISLRDPGSDIDVAYPSGRVGSRFFRGSGTSQAAAVVSGASAVLLQRYPTLTPDQVKQLLMSTAAGFAGAGILYRGAGALDVGKAVAARPVTVPAMPSLSTGTGSLDEARGSAHVAVGGVELTGERDILGARWPALVWARRSAAGQAWNGGSWNGSTWTGPGWTDPSWLGATWSVVPWAGNDWSGSPWLSHSWTSHSWTSAGWTGGDWSSHSWTSHSWTASTWAGFTWN